MAPVLSMENHKHLSYIKINCSPSIKSIKSIKTESSLSTIDHIARWSAVIGRRRGAADELRSALPAPDVRHPRRRMWKSSQAEEEQQAEEEEEEKHRQMIDIGASRRGQSHASKKQGHRFRCPLNKQRDISPLQLRSAVIRFDSFQPLPK
ncbi:unnamed protein product [Arctogadus glacialis]